MNAAIGASGDAPADTRPDESAARGDARSVRLLGLGLFLAALGAGIGFLAAGAALPPLFPLLGLAAIAGLCVNCEVFFPSELASTAESAAIFAAIVGMRTTSPWLGPLAVALTVGPLDILHWRQRAYFRMAYNSGSQGLAALAGAAIFGLVDASVGTAYAVACAVVAAVPYALADSTLGFWLMRIRGESVRAAARHQWSLNAVAFPLAAIGAVAGVLAGERGWWLALLVLIPVPWVPELLLVWTPAWCRRQPQVRLRAFVTVTALLVTAVAAVVWSPAPLTLAALLVFAVLLGVDLRVDVARVVPPLVGIVAVAAAVVHDGNGWVAAPLVAVAATVVAWRALVPARALVVGIGAGGACAGIARVITPRAGSLAAVLVAIAAAGAFAIVAIACGGRGRARATLIPRFAWSAPLFLVAALLAEAWGVLGIGGGIVYGAGVAHAVVGTGWWGAAPWGSRGLARVSAAWVPRRHRAATALMVLATGTLATVAALAPGRHRALALVTAAAVEIVAAGALVAVRQWSFVPRRRLWSTAVVALVAVLAVVGYLPLARTAPVASVAVAMALVLLVAFVVWPFAGLLDRAGAGPAVSEEPELVDSEPAARTRTWRSSS
jgi:hypothetical protein